MKEIATPTRTKEIVERYNLKAKKKSWTELYG